MSVRRIGLINSRRCLENLMGLRKLKGTMLRIEFAGRRQPADPMVGKTRLDNAAEYVDAVRSLKSAVLRGKMVAVRYNDLK